MENPRGLPWGRILVTGGAGFIGSALVWGLNRAGVDRIVIVDRLGRSDKWRNLAPLRFEDYLEADDLLPQLERGSLGAFDHVFHMGACSSTLERDASFLMRNNFEVTKTLALWALSHDARFAYASSAATYGDGAAGMLDDVQCLPRLRPLNAYGYSKHIFDQYASSHGMFDHLVGLKFFNVFGSNEAHKGEMRSLVYKAYDQMKRGQPVQLFRSENPAYADGEQQRDLVYIKDVVAMVLHLASAPACRGIYNIGTGTPTTCVNLVSAVAAAMGRTPAIEFIDMPASMQDRYQYRTRADISRLRASGFDAAITPFDQAVAEYVRDYLIPDRRLGDPAAPTA